MRRCGAVRRGWPLLVPILLLTQALPAALISLLSLAVDPTARWDAELADNPDGLPDTFLTGLAAMVGVLVGGLVMFHERFGLVLGRVALVAAAIVVVSVVAGIVEAVGGLPFGTTPLDSPGTAVGIVVVSLIGAVLALPAYLAQLAGLIVTYAEQRACEGPVNAARLAAELG